MFYGVDVAQISGFVVLFVGIVASYVRLRTSFENHSSEEAKSWARVEHHMRDSSLHLDCRAWEMLEARLARIEAKLDAINNTRK